MKKHVVPRGRSTIATIAAGFVFVVAGCGGAASPSATAPSSAAASVGDLGSLADVCAKGAEEGQLVHWHNHSDAFSAVVEAFNEDHPEIEVEELVLAADEITQRVLTEASAGRQITPDTAAGGLDVFNALFDREIIATDIDWAAMGAPEDYIHELGIIRIHRVASGIVYNTDTHTADDMPDTWEELIDEKWRGRVIVDPRGRPFDSIGLAWGEEEALDYVQRLKDVVNPLVIEGGTAGMVAVAGGEADITTGGRSAETLEQQAEGAPLEIKYLDVVTTLDQYNVIFKDAQHPNAARCFVGWFATEGQELYNEVEFKRNESIPPGAPEGVTLVTIDTPEDADKVSELGREMGRLWTGG